MTFNLASQVRAAANRRKGMRGLPYACADQLPRVRSAVAPFEIKDEAKHDATADVAPILKIDAMTPQVFQIKTRDFFRHLNPAGAESVRVEFLSGWVTYKMWLPIERMPGMCNKFWKSHGGAAPCPTTANEWLARQAELRPSKEFLYRKKWLAILPGQLVFIGGDDAAA
jgi:hypothetical protein